jgi:hypothetical protein
MLRRELSQTLQTGSYSFFFKQKGLPWPCLPMGMGCEGDGRLYRGREKEPGPDFYMCCAEHLANSRNFVMHTLDYPPYVELIGLTLLLYDAIVKILLRNCYMWGHH